jgi:hypothetical protein
MLQEELRIQEITTLEQARGEYMSSLEYMRDEDGRGEPVFAGFADASLQIMRGEDNISPGLSEEFNKVINELLELRVLNPKRTIDIEYAREITVRAFQRQALKAPHLDYPDAHDDPQVWVKTIDWILNDPCREELEIDLEMRQIQTNEVQRAVGFLIVAAAFRDRLNQDANVLIELGSSDNLILTALAKHREFEIAVDSTNDDERAWLQTAVTRHLPITKAIGIDILTPEEEWIDACRRASELGRDQAERDALRQARPNNVVFHRADFSNHKSMLNFYRQNPNLHADIAGIVASTYMQKPVEQVRSLRELKLLSADAEFVLEWALPNQSDPTQLDMARKIHTRRANSRALPFALNARLADDPNRNWHNLAIFDSGRAKRVTISSYLSRIIKRGSSEF